MIETLIFTACTYYESNSLLDIILNDLFYMTVYQVLRFILLEICDHVNISAFRDTL